MTLGELIAFLEKRDPRIVVPMGFNGPHSYRGIYRDLAFEPVRDTTVGEMLACAKDALGRTFDGYKGGDFVMDENVDVYLSNYGEASGETIGITLLLYMVGETDAS